MADFIGASPCKEVIKGSAYEASSRQCSSADEQQQWRRRSRAAHRKQIHSYKQATTVQLGSCCEVGSKVCPAQSQEWPRKDQHSHIEFFLEDEALSSRRRCKSEEKRGTYGQRRAGDNFTRLQAIITDLPQHALAADSWIPARASLGGSLERFREKLVERELLRSCKQYPRYAADLRHLVVVHASEDLTILVDNKHQKMYTSVRGTNPLKARDLKDDARIVLGFPPERVALAKETYCRIRDSFLGYDSYGCGHSLGGTVMHELTCCLEQDSIYAFKRVDVFNAGGSPFRPKGSALTHTEFYSHRVAGDLVSFFYEPPKSPAGDRGNVEHVEKPQIWSHGLGHFLPKKHPRSSQQSCYAVAVKRENISSEHPCVIN